MTDIDIDAIRHRAGRVRFRTCEPGTDHEAYELARDAQTLLAKVDELTAERDNLVAYNRSVKNANADLRAQLTAANRRADGPEADLRSAVKGNDAYANQTEELKRDLALAVEDRNKMKAKLDGSCGSCHPCVNYSDETWRAAGRKPPHVVTWDDAQAELKALRPVAAAAEAWAKASVAGIEHRPHEEALYAAVQTLPDPAKHEDFCTGYGCPGCRDDQPSEAEATR